MVLQVGIYEFTPIVGPQGMNLFLEFHLYCHVQVNDGFYCITLVFQVEHESKTRAVIVNDETESGMSPVSFGKHRAYEIGM